MGTADGRNRGGFVGWLVGTGRASGRRVDHRALGFGFFLLVASASASFAASPSPALAQDPLTEVAAIGRGDSPTSFTFLGWTADERAVVRIFLCSEGGERMCSSSVGVYTAGLPSTVTETFSYEGYDPVAPADARAFVAAERRALAALPPLTAAAPLPDAASAFGSVASTPVVLRVGARPRPSGPDDFPRQSLDAVAPLGARVRVLDLGSAQSVNGIRVTAYPSPGGKLVALVIGADTTTMCWDSSSLDVVVVDVARVRAQLANAVGFRAYRAGHVSEALDRFREATVIAPTHALAWHNRASVESRTGDVAAALASERLAIRLDPSMAARACRDTDFAALRATPDGAALLRCPTRAATGRGGS